MDLQKFLKRALIESGKTFGNIVERGENKVDQHVLLSIPFSHINERNHHLTLSQTSPGFTCLQYTSLENTLGKEEIACNKQFLLFPQCFLSFRRTSLIFIKLKIVVCKPFQFGGLEFVVWERVNQHLVCCLQMLPIWSSTKFHHLVEGQMRIIVNVCSGTYTTELKTITRVLINARNQKSHLGTCHP